MRQKCIKMQKARNRPTEKRAINNIENDEVAKWTRKIDEAAMTSNVQEKIKAVADVVWELVGEVRADRVHYSVFFTLLGRRNLIASLNLLHRLHGIEWAREIGVRKLNG